MKNGRYEENGNIIYYKDDKRHREDGPAVLFSNGNGWHYLNDISYTKEEFEQWLAKKELNEKLETTLESKPKEKKKKI